jgi:signal transduction histidine kinase/uncharacterized membrane protein affecting hemolysin expression
MKIPQLKQILGGSLKRQLVIGITLIVAVTVSLFVWDQVRRQQIETLQQQSDQVRVLAKGVATSVSVWVAARDYGGLQEIVDNFAQYPDLKHVIVLDLRGQILAHTDSTRRGLYLTDLPNEIDTKIIRLSKKTVEVFTPILLNARPIGWVRIGLSRERMTAQLAGDIRHGIFITLVSTLLSLLLAILTGRYLMRRLNDIQMVANAVNAGQSSARVELHGDDEASQLAQHFNRMLDSLAQRKEELQESERSLLNILNLSPIAVRIAIQHGHRVAFSNPRYAELIKSANPTGDDPENYYAHADDYKEILDQLTRGEVVLNKRVELNIPDGSTIWALASYMPMQYEGEAAVLGWFFDITASKDHEDNLQRSNAELEQFSYAVSHDMRQPLRMISSYLQLIEMTLGDQLDAEKRSFFKFAVEGAKRIDHMLVALLEFSRIGRKGEPPIWIDSQIIRDEALQFLQPNLSEAHANISVTGDWPRIFVGRDEILRLLQNLIANAVKYRVAGRTPEILIHSEIINNEWHLSVSDNGIGIIPDQISRLFKVFQRLQTRDAYEGTGIGLALCRKIVEHHKGHIWVESLGEGFGSQFYVTLPVLVEPKTSLKGIVL